MIRLATLADARAIAELHVASWRAAYVGILPPAYLEGLSVEEREAGWRSRLAAGRQVWLARDGFAAAGSSRDDDATAGDAEIYAIHVHPASWRRGVGRDLLAAACAALAPAPITLWVIEGNARARAFYQAAGFRLDGGRKEKRFGDTLVCEVRYRLQ